MATDYKKKKKNVKVEGKETNIKLKGPATFKSDLKGGALDEIVAPKVKKVKEEAEKLKTKGKEFLKKTKREGKKIVKKIKTAVKKKKSGTTKYKTDDSGGIRKVKYPGMGS